VAGKKIAVIDDEGCIARLLCIELKTEGYDVVTAGDGEAGLKLIQEEKPDLVLLDLMMPKMNGFEVLEVLRANVETRDVSVVLLTAKNSVHDIQKALELGIEDYIVKPFHAELLVKRIGRLVS